MVVLNLTKEEQQIVEKYAKIKNMKIEDCIKNLVLTQIQKEYEISLKAKEIEKTIEKTRVLDIPNFVSSGNTVKKEETQEIHVEDIPEDFNILKNNNITFFYDLMNEKLENASSKDKKYIELILEKCDSYIYENKAYDNHVFSQKDILSTCRDFFKYEDYVERVYLYGDYLDTPTSDSPICLLVVFNDDSFGGIKYFYIIDELYKLFHKQIEIMTDAKFVGKDILLIYKKKHEY